MEKMIPIVVFGALILIIITGVIWGKIAERKGTEQWELAAKALGMPFFSNRRYRFGENVELSIILAW